MDQVQKFALTTTIIHLGVQYLGNLKRRLIVHIDERWGRLDPIGDHIGVAGSSMDTWITGWTA